MSEPVIQCKNLKKSYGAITALEDFTVDIQPGAVGLLGPNGAGKTTLMKILMGVLQPDSGEVNIFGQSLSTSYPEYLREVGYMPQKSCIIPDHTGLSYVTYLGEISGMARKEALGRAHEVLYFVGVGEERYRPMGTLSFGQQRRINLAQALVHDPKLLLLDEPTTGLDTDIRQEVLELIRQIAQQYQKPVFISSQILHDIEFICDSVVLIEKKPLYTGKIDELLKGEHNHYDLRLTGNPAPFVAALEKRKISVLAQRDDHVKVELPGDVTPNQLLEVAVETDVYLRQIKPVQNTLEDIFIERFGKKS